MYVCIVDFGFAYGQQDIYIRVTHIRTYIHKQTHKYVYASKGHNVVFWMSTHTYIHTHTHIHAHVYVYKYIHTHANRDMHQRATMLFSWGALAQLTL